MQSAGCTPFACFQVVGQMSDVIELDRGAHTYSPTVLLYRVDGQRGWMLTMKRSGGWKTSVNGLGETWCAMAIEWVIRRRDKTRRDEKSKAADSLRQPFAARLLFFFFFFFLPFWGVDRRQNFDSPPNECDSIVRIVRVADATNHWPLRTRRRSSSVFLFLIPYDSCLIDQVKEKKRRNGWQKSSRSSIRH